MIKTLLSGFLFIHMLASQGQLILKPLPYLEPEQKNVNEEPEDRELVVPFWDDFSYGNSMPDTNLWKIGRNIYINNTLPTKAPTKFVATFDGVDQNGRPYVTGGSDFSGLGDVLQTHTINLAKVPVNRRNTVFLSFYWQLQGNGNLPNEDDSLQLQFYSLDSVWITQNINPSNPDRLALTGGFSNQLTNEDNVPVFRQIIIQISNPIYFHRNFAFRFRSFSNLSGIYDNWHLDYIYLNQNRNSRDTTHFDRSIVGPQTSAIAPYHSMPLHQYLINPSKYASPILVTVSNLDNTFHPLTYSHFLSNTISGQEIQLSNAVDGNMTPYERRRIISGLSIAGLDVTSEMDSVSFRSTFIYHTGDKNLFEVVGSNGDTLFLPIDLKQNDTLTAEFTLHDYYAYDDGTAEFSAGINLIGGKLAVMFILEEPDTLTDIQIHFPAIQPNTEGQGIDILVLSRPDDRQILRRQPYVIKPSSRNEFQNITLSVPILVRDTFLIGFEQSTNNYIGVGFDKNSYNGSGAIYSNTNLQWVQNTRLQGSLMIRPVFKPTSDFVLGNEFTQKSQIVVYPNPTDGQLNIDGDYEQLKITDMTGKVIQIWDQTKYLNLSHLSNGIYIFEFRYKQTIQTHRIIIRHEP